MSAARRRPTAAVVGAGIAGLAAAHALATHPSAPRVVVLDAAARAGGKVRTARFAGLPVDVGPDAMLARLPWAVELCREVGLGERLVAPATGQAFVWTRGRLRPLPAGLVLGLPADAAGLARLAASGVISPAGAARAALDLVLPARGAGAASDPSVAEVVGGRFGPEVVDRLVEPLLGGINAGPASRLSLAAVAPEVAAAAAGRRSLLLALRAMRRANPPDPSRPLFLGLAGGLGALPERLVAVLREAGAEVRLGEAAGDLGALGADAVVLAVPAPAAAGLLAPLAPGAAGALAAVAHASVAIVTLAYPAGAPARPLAGSGFLVPAGEGRLVTAATWLSSKWPALTPRGLVLVRASVGRAGDDHHAALDDGRLAAAVHAELAEAMDLRAEPAEVLVTRWPAALPQYEPGHLARVAEVEAAVAAAAPNVALAGAAYRGLGLASCVRQGREAAARVLARLAP